MKLITMLIILINTDLLIGSSKNVTPILTEKLLKSI